jgi:hypothetical protein
MFYSYLEHIADLEGRQVIIINCISDFFAPSSGYNYYIMDPYLNPITSLQEPFRDRKLENSNWSFLLAELAASGCKFHIFTAESTNGLMVAEKDPPYEIISDGQLSSANVYVCQYPRSAYNGLDIHDRYILQETESEIKGLHIGPSLEDTQNKDVALSAFSQNGAENALSNFKCLWNECIRTRAWKKG